MIAGSPVKQSSTVPAQARPLWKRVASRARASAYRVVTLVDRIVRWRSDALMPPAHLRVYYYGTWSPKPLLHASEVARTELITRGLRPEHRVLDIGSGIGSLPLGLLDYRLRTSFCASR